jgi:mono/diheme cytochrome c family protein
MMLVSRRFASRLLLVLFGMLAAVSPIRAQDAAAAAKGESIFAREKCAMCHSVAGKGAKKYPLDGAGTRLTAPDIREWLVNPDGQQAKKGDRPLMKMKSFKTLPADELDALVAYVQSLK